MELPGFINQEFMKIPLYGVVEHAILGFVLQPLVNGVGRLLDADFGGHREGHPVVAVAESLNVGFAARLLPSKIIAGEADNDQFIVEFVV